MKVRHLLGLAVVLLVAAVVAGCGGGEDKNKPVVEFEETLGFGGDQAKEVQSQVENRIRDCMKAQGFDYVPVDPFAQQQALTGKARITDEDFTRQFGYGISTFFGKAAAHEDPNERIRRSLSQADRAAYDRALGGENPGVTFAEAADSGDFTQLGGCTKQASEAAFGGPAVLTQLVEKLDELDEAIIQDQRMVRANEKWAQCMAEKGYRYDEPDSIDSDIEERFQAIVGTGVSAGASTVPEGASFDRAALTQLQQEEVRIANADVDCEEEHIVPVEREIRPQYEQRFQKENQRLIARVKTPGQSQ